MTHALLCSSCGAPAELQVDADFEKQTLCTRCFDRAFPNLPIGRLLTSFPTSPRRTGTCPHCGWTQKQLDDTAHMGCPLCYQALVWKR